ncbi:hypothetical protein [Acidocella sp.]|uniref:hypothetical protein n=1 Tax=Acidocella sp. TaxID=50710 RepID=UPI002615AB0F|nr:hypothetical protein [Acidocella sp.]
MKVSKFASALAFAATLAAAPAFAQSASGTMAPMQGMSSPAAAAPAATMAPVQSATHAMSAPAAAAKSAVKSVKGKLAADQEFKTEAAAAAHCPGDQVVWSALTKSKSFHTSHSKYFGKTKHGAYVCEKDALAAGFHKAKN